MNDDSDSGYLLDLTAQIVSAHVSNNSMPAEGLPALIQSIFKTLSGTGVIAAPPEKPQPAVSVKSSVFPDYIVCLEDGQKLKMLKRHLAAAYQMTPEQYRARWGLPASYPMIAPNYAAQRAMLAKRSGLGRGRQAEPLVTKIPERGRRGRRAK